jgi:23S rRNA pseudouridine1911/1915/1917 synthase
LAHRGFPLVGDPMYGGRRRALAEASAAARRFADTIVATVDRPALHARRLQLIHPRTAAALDVESPLPPDLRALVDLLQGMG